MDFADFRDLAAGIEKKIQREVLIHKSIRKMAFLNLLPHAKEGLSFGVFCRDYWPMPDDEEIQSEKYDPRIDAELYEQMIKAHNLKISKGRRAKDA